MPALFTSRTRRPGDRAACDSRPSDASPVGKCTASHWNPRPPLNLDLPIPLPTTIIHTRTQPPTRSTRDSDPTTFRPAPEHQPNPHPSTALTRAPTRPAPTRTRPGAGAGGASCLRLGLRCSAWVGGVTRDERTRGSLASLALRLAVELHAAKRSEAGCGGRIFLR